MPAQFSDPTPGIVLDPQGNEPTDVCIPNISPRERKKRKNFGIMLIVLGITILAAMLLFGADKLWRLPLFLLFTSGATSIFQALDKT